MLSLSIAHPNPTDTYLCGWDADGVREVARSMGIELRVGHRMQIISLLQREQARAEEARNRLIAAAGGVGTGLSQSPPLIRDVTAGSPARRVRQSSA